MSAKAWLAAQPALLTHKIMRTGLWALVLVGAAGGVYGALRPTPRPPAPKPAEVTTGHEGVAALYVATWLRGGGRPGTGLDAFYPGPVATDPLTNLEPPVAVSVERVVPIEPRVISPGYVAVTVAAEVIDGDAAITHFYRADILRVDRNADGSSRPAIYVATALPFEVAAPLGARLPALDVDEVALSSVDPMANRLSRFLAAMLTGVGEVNDYTAPGAAVRAVRPAPFTSVVLVGIAQTAVEGPVKTLDVVVTITATDRAGRRLPLAYPLELTQRSGRWEVAKVMQAPVLAADQGDLVAATTVPLLTTTVPLPTTTTVPASTTRPALTPTTILTATTTTTTTTRAQGR